MRFAPSLLNSVVAVAVLGLTAGFARATSLPVIWSTPETGKPVLQLVPVPRDVCARYNFLSRGDNGILKQPFAMLVS